MSMNPSESALLQSARAALLQSLPDLVAAYVFGSVAENSQRADSDLDLAVLGERKLDPVRRLELQRELGALLDRDIDLIDLREASTVLRQEVIARGTLLLQRDAMQTLDFEARTLSDYGALMDATRELRMEIRKRGRVGVP